jgi:lipopolysaccharide biosynthesis protein/glycosyltransferase involved in cell wall biosynthesis
VSRRALVCSYGPPRYDRDAGSLRLWHQLDFLQEAGWHITFLTASPEEDNRYARDLLARGIPVYAGRSTRAEEVIGDGRFDLALCAFWQVAELYLPILREVSPETCVVVDSVDLQFIREARRVFTQQSQRSSPRLLGGGFGSETASELNVYAAADAVLAVSAEEADFLGGLVGDSELVSCVPLAEGISVRPVPLANRAGIVFVGSFRHLPNVDALEYFCADIVPLLDESLLSRHPISIVGDGLDETAMTIPRDLPHVNLVGWTPKLLPYFEHARVSVVPLRYGAGTKQKVIQALMAGTPVVASSVGAEGLGVKSGTHLLVADDPAATANSLERVLEDDALWRRLSKQGRELVAANHSPTAVGQSLFEAIDRALHKPRKPPMLPARGVELYEYRTRTQEYQKMAAQLRVLLPATIPDGATVLVLSEGSDELLQLGREARHFPPLENGSPRELNESEAAIALIQDEIDHGANFLLVPTLLRWWLTRLPDFHAYLEREGEFSSVGSCLLIDLRRIAAERRAAAPDAEAKGGEVERRLPANLPAKLIAFYLPQFHPIPENDEWWGEGFTEWTNVVNAEPLFTGHYQPHIPADLGFYDLRLAATRDAQAELAREAGIHAFCYYHYWFGGKRLLQRPFDEILASGRPDFPFCLCWANEPWSRRWDGRDNEVLQPQTYSDEDDREHIRWLIPALSDARALTVEGKPLFIVYQARDLPDPARTADLWRRQVRRAGLPGIYLVSVETGWDAGWDATDAGFDAKVLFQPQFSTLSTVPRHDADGPPTLRVFDYDQAWPVLSNPDPVSYRRYETVCAGWDNSPRTGARGWLLHGSTPEAYEEWLHRAITRAQEQSPDHRLVFLNAWNEWAEGAHLEPDQEHGDAYLQATRRALERAVPPRPAPAPAPAPVEALSVQEPEPRPDARTLELALLECKPPRARAFAFFLPQFHPIPENDEWWGKGFTEWTNVARARPLFPGHYQPHLPANLGFYDLRVAEARERQADLARQHGIEAFCYWHYWFCGKRLLERPFEETLESGRPNFPLLLAWANESWSRRWLGEEKELLLKQEYSPEDDLAHARWLAEAFADPRYVRVHGRPPFLVYRPTKMPEPERTAEVIKEVCTDAGLPEPLLLGVNAFKDIDYRTLGYDGTVDFEPQLGALGKVLEDGLKVHDYVEARRLMAERQRERSFAVYPSVVVGWDNTPRRGEDGIVLTDSTPAAFEEGLRDALVPLLSRPFEDRLLFLNAWNEWAEGNHLEPDRRYGLGHLEAVRRLLLGDPRQSLTVDPSAAEVSEAAAIT